MNYEFQSKNELFLRVRPALKIKEKELRKLGFNIKEIDVWNYLGDTKWSRGSDLALSDIVNDILTCNGNDILEYLKNKNI